MPWMPLPRDMGPRGRAQVRWGGSTGFGVRGVERGGFATSVVLESPVRLILRYTCVYIIAELRWFCDIHTHGLTETGTF